MKLFIIRHGETEANIAGVFQGQYDSPLTKKGLAQAKRTGDFLEDKGIEVIISSPLPRAKRTAELINQSLEVDILTDDLLTEVNYGSWDGKSKEWVKKNFPVQWSERNANKYSFIHPGGYNGSAGESYESQQIKVKQFIENLKSLKYNSLLIVTHLGFSKNLRIYLEKNKIKTIMDGHINNDKILEYEL